MRGEPSSSKEAAPGGAQGRWVGVLWKSEEVEVTFVVDGDKKPGGLWEAQRTRRAAHRLQVLTRPPSLVAHPACMTVPSAMV